MLIRLWDEVLPLGGRGVLLLTDHMELLPGALLRDARGNVHTVSRAEPQDDWLTLFIENGDPAYFQRLFRDVRIDATAFTLLTGGSTAEEPQHQS